MTYRGTTLIMEPSHLYQGGVVLRHPGTLQTVAAFKSVKFAKAYCRFNGYSHMPPVKNVRLSDLEQRI